MSWSLWKCLGEGLVVCGVSLGTFGCSSIASSPLGADRSGLVYSLPNRDIVVRVTIDDKDKVGIELLDSPYYGDTSARFLLKHRRGVVTDNDMSVTVSEDGLLQSSDLKTESRVSDILSSISSGVGTLGIVKEDEFRSTATCPAGSYDITVRESTVDRSEDSKSTSAAHRVDKRLLLNGQIPLPGAGDNCKLNVELRWLGAPPANFPNTKDLVDNAVKTKQSASCDPCYSDEAKEMSGVFYRQSQPYQLSVSFRSTSREFVVLTPSYSETFFLPVSKTLFATNTTKLEFQNGVPTTYSQDTTSELAGFFSWPAEVVEAYFGAVGAIFGKLRDSAESEAEYLKALNQLELTKTLSENCERAIRAEDEDAIEEYCVSN